MAVRGRRKVLVSPRCPDRSHAKSHVTGNGFVRGRATGDHRVRQWVCQPLTGGRHTFTLVVSDERPIAPPQPNPPCPHHPAARRKRDGTYGRGATLRQRYRCYPAGDKSHAFTPPLPRGVVDPEATPCSHCEEQRGVHHGETAAARQHVYSTRLIARGLDLLSVGEPYAQVGLMAWKEIHRDPAVPTKPTPKRKPPERVWNVATEAWDEPRVQAPKSVSLGSVESRAAWRIAANWVEAFAPVVWDPIDARIRAAAPAVPPCGGLGRSL